MSKVELDRQVEVLLKDLFAVCRHMQNALHGINAQVSAVKYHLEKGNKQFADKCFSNIDKKTRYIYDGDEYGFFPRVDEVLRKTQGYLTENGCFGEFNDYVGFMKGDKQ